MASSERGVRTVVFSAFVGANGASRLVLLDIGCQGQTDVPGEGAAGRQGVGCWG